MTQGRVVAIGVGNLDRGDDAAGREVARRLRAAGESHAEIIELDGEATRILSALEGAEAAFLIDACFSGATAGAIHRFDAAEGLPATATFGLSSHGFGLAEAVELAKALGALPLRCIVYAIEGESFDIGGPVSAAVTRAIEEVAMHVRDEILALPRHK
ncbi:hydrogenase maturation protease [Methylocystis sp. JR02]|uniref:hydrogenase maturation protease n=1 Tax=Methylocystis sp. JR02 TaxID=3046284 RepID=UPI0024B9BE30|nr:hydrogenase maturation protease [Methylocystis sp. JR02]MDJ0449081.1 hydrogenase maturation protease [Methylocystis sp. JR02]